MDLVPAIARWVHFLAGVMWVGLLYYFNFVQIPALKAAAADGTAAGITKHVAPRALLYFRWSSIVTWLAGAAILGGNFVGAFTLQKGLAGIGVGAWLGTIMLINVWALIWPNQQKILGLKPATDEEKNKARRVALLTSRANMMLSITARWSACSTCSRREARSALFHVPREPARRAQSSPYSF
jgi:uncharacterized membrane protein